MTSPANLVAPHSGETSDWDRDAALCTARLLLEIKAINFRPEEPYTLTSGWKSPVYIDCRRIIFFPRARAKIMELGVEKIGRHVGYESIDAVVGGETAGIPFAAWMADRMMLPMAYVRKKPKALAATPRLKAMCRKTCAPCWWKISPRMGPPRSLLPMPCAMPVR